MISREQKKQEWGAPIGCLPTLVFIFMPVQTVCFIYSFPTLFYDVDQVGNLTCYGCIRRTAEWVSF